MRHQIALAAALALIAGCSDSDAPEQQAPAPATEPKVEQQAAPAPAPEPEIQPQPEIAANVVMYECDDGVKFEAEFVDQGVVMVINDMSYDLRQQPAASGSLYADGSTSFHTQEQEALWTDAQGTRSCQEVPAEVAGAADFDNAPELVPEPANLIGSDEEN